MKNLHDRLGVIVQIYLAKDYSGFLSLGKEIESRFVSKLKVWVLSCKEAFEEALREKIHVNYGTIRAARARTTNMISGVMALIYKILSQIVIGSDPEIWVGKVSLMKSPDFINLFRRGIFLK